MGHGRSLCVCTAHSYSHSSTESRLQSFEIFELSCKKWYDNLTFRRFNKHRVFLSIWYLPSVFRTSWIIFRRFGETISMCQERSHKITCFHSLQSPEHTEHHPAFSTSWKSPFLSLTLLFRSAPTHEWEANTRRVFIFVGRNPRPRCPKSTEWITLYQKTWKYFGCKSETSLNCFYKNVHLEFGEKPLYWRNRYYSLKSQVHLFNRTSVVSVNPIFLIHKRGRWNETHSQTVFLCHVFLKHLLPQLRKLYWGGGLLKFLAFMYASDAMQLEA